MMRNQFRNFFAAVLLAALPAFAGPPMICHPLNIGSEASLPWGTGSGWDLKRVDYQISRLATDTVALIGPERPVVARMETIRRAVIYSTGNTKATLGLFAALTARTIEATGSDKGNALFDLAYFVGAVQQMRHVSGHQPFEHINPKPWFERAQSLGTDKASVNFALALMHEGTLYREYLRKAETAAPKGSLLARVLDERKAGN